MAENGIETTEYKVTQTAAVMGVIVMVLGILVAAGASVVAAITDVNPTAGILAGALVSVAGVIQKTLVDLGYIKGRSQVKSNPIK